MPENQLLQLANFRNSVDSTYFFTLAVKLRQAKITQIEADNSTALFTLPCLLISVCNSGVEIPAEGLSRLFEPFYRLPNSDHYNQGGTWLGLALVNKLVVALNGSIRVESSKGQTCFIIEFY